jgi:hypothetical protein
LQSPDQPAHQHELRRALDTVARTLKFPNKAVLPQLPDKLHEAFPFRTAHDPQQSEGSVQQEASAGKRRVFRGLNDLRRNG